MCVKVILARMSCSEEHPDDPLIENKWHVCMHAENLKNTGKSAVRVLLVVAGWSRQEGVHAENISQVFCERESLADNALCLLLAQRSRLARAVMKRKSDIHELLREKKLRRCEVDGPTSCRCATKFHLESFRTNMENHVCFWKGCGVQQKDRWYLHVTCIGKYMAVSIG